MADGGSDNGSCVCYVLFLAIFMVLIITVEHRHVHSVLRAEILPVPIYKVILQSDTAKVYAVFYRFASVFMPRVFYCVLVDRHLRWLLGEPNLSLKRD